MRKPLNDRNTENKSVDPDLCKCTLCKAIECKITEEATKINQIDKAGRYLLSRNGSKKSKVIRKLELPFGWVQIGNDYFCAKCYHQVDELGAYRHDWEQMNKSRLEAIKERTRRSYED